MSGLAFGAFAESLAGGMKDKRERQALADDAARQDRYLSAIEKQYGGSAPMGAMPQQPGGMGAAPAGAGMAGDGSLFSLIDQKEGGGNYDTLFGHSQNGGRFDGVKVSDMTIAQLSDFSDPNGEYGQWVKSSLAASGQDPRVATPMGRHQIVGTTLRAAAKQMGLSPDNKFTPQTQDAIANHLARGRLSASKTPAAKRAAMRAEWEGFKNVSDAALDAAIANFEANGGMSNPRQLGAMEPR